MVSLLLSLVGCSYINESIENTKDTKAQIEKSAEDLPDRIRKGECILVDDQGDQGLISVNCLQQNSTRVYSRFSIPWLLTNDDISTEQQYPFNMIVDCSEEKITVKPAANCKYPVFEFYRNLSNVPKDTQVTIQAQGVASRIISAACDLSEKSGETQEAWSYDFHFCARFEHL